MIFYCEEWKKPNTSNNFQERLCNWDTQFLFLDNNRNQIVDNSIKEEEAKPC